MISEWYDIGAELAWYHNDLSHFERLLGMTRASGITARRAGMKFHQWPAAAEDQIWQ
jgi:hypothetical protein